MTTQVATPVDVLKVAPSNGANGNGAHGKHANGSSSGRLSVLSRLDRWSVGSTGLSAVQESAPAPSASSSEKANRFSQAQATAWKMEGRGRQRNSSSGRSSAGDMMGLEERLESAERRAEAAEQRAEIAEMRYEEVCSLPIRVRSLTIQRAAVPAFCAYL